MTIKFCLEAGGLSGHYFMKHKLSEPSFDATAWESFAAMLTCSFFSIAP